MEQKAANIQKRALNIHRELRELTFKLARIIKTLFLLVSINHCICVPFSRFLQSTVCGFIVCISVYLTASEGVACGKPEKTTSAFKWLNCHTGFLRKKERVETLL